MGGKCKDVSPIKTYRIHFIRHGLTQGNLDGKYIGATDQPLCREGIEELEELRREYEYPRAEKVYTSPLKRCLQTADILFPDCPAEPVDALREYDFGLFEDKSMPELADDPAFQAWTAGGMAAPPPGGEDRNEFDKRIRHGFAVVLDDMMKNRIFDAALVSHGGILMGLLAAYGYPRRKPLDWRIGNGKGYTVLVTPQLWMGGQVFEVFDPLPYGCENTADMPDYDVVEIDDTDQE